MQTLERIDRMFHYMTTNRASEGHVIRMSHFRPAATTTWKQKASAPKSKRLVRSNTKSSARDKDCKSSHTKLRARALGRNTPDHNSEWLSMAPSLRVSSILDASTNIMPDEALAESGCW